MIDRHHFLIQVVKAPKYFAIISLLEVGHVPPLVCMVCFMASLSTEFMNVLWV
jgi:hypothetical protein